ncbi:hypothetical protein AJ79_08329 [Helicocarpus griseus UAMH5409]|uniref:Uncharacterized protein n=1 Tax=Helicocarpus griseus UAMH5409 TaxID=1447875 RepID=A0A2B7WUB2_9EURO|nr:hypothetical protein AJ79_08329 [Helicocarpus griseus UAMH5409]
MLASKIAVALDVVASDTSISRIALGFLFGSSVHTNASISHYDQHASWTETLFSSAHKPMERYPQLVPNILQKRACTTYQSEETSQSANDASIQISNDGSNNSQGTSFPFLQSLTSWPDGNFGILPISAADFMVLESMGYSYNTSIANPISVNRNIRGTYDVQIDPVLR